MLIKNCVFRVLLFLTVILQILILPSYSANIIRSKSSKTYSGPVKSYMPVMIVTGDSYAGYFSDYEDNKDFMFDCHAVAGRRVKDNKEVMLDACDCGGDYIVFSIGVNDHYQETMPYEFEAVMRECISKASLNKKIIFVHSYVEYPASMLLNRRFSTYTYDAILRRIANEVHNMYYIDMHDMKGLEYVIQDNIHYGRTFYDVLYNRICNVIMTLNHGNLP